MVGGLDGIEFQISDFYSIKVEWTHFYCLENGFKIQQTTIVELAQIHLFQFMSHRIHFLS